MRSVVWLSEPLSAWEVPAELLSLAAELLESLELLELLVALVLLAHQVPLQLLV